MKRINLNDDGLRITNPVEDIEVIVSGSSSLIVENAASLNIKVTLLENSELKFDSYYLEQIKSNYVFDVLENATLKLKNISLNENDTRIEINLNGYNSTSVVDTLQIGSKKNSKIDTVVNHNFKNTVSHVNNYGIALQGANIEFNTAGKIKKGMSKSECGQMTRGIISGKDSSIKALPLLYIDEYDVKANHGAAIGKMSDDELYYLMSRGIDKTDAFKLILSGIVNPFLDDLVDNNSKEIIEENIYKLI